MHGMRIYRYMRNLLNYRRGMAMLCAFLLFQAAAEAKFARPEFIPTERLIQNTEAYRAENPNDPQALFILARIHYLTFRNRIMLVQSFSNRGRENQLPGVVDDYFIGDSIKDDLLLREARKRAGEGASYQREREELEKLKKENWTPEFMSDDEALQYAAKAEGYFEMAAKADPENALYYLGWASLREELATFISGNGIKYPEWKGAAEEELATTIRKYHRAYELSIDEDLKRKHLPLRGLTGLVGHESAAAIVRLMKANPKVAKTLKDIKTRTIEKNQKKLKKLPMGAITPIIISMTGSTSISDAVTQKEVLFDVDGDGVKEWIDSWPKADTGILVWDPSGAGQIESGTQLFGTFSFRMIWRNGYEALGGLDDSRDQRLSGAELPGLAVWFDQNENAVSEPGEVRTVSEMAITEIDVQPAEVSEGVLTNREGIRFQNGETAASLDWLFNVVKQGGESR